MGTTQNGLNGSEVLLEQLNAQGVDCIFVSPIAVMAPIWEALTRRADDKPRYFRCRQELLAVSLASMPAGRWSRRRSPWFHQPSDSLAEFSPILREKGCSTVTTTQPH